MNKTFYKHIIAVTLPIAFQNIVSYSVNMMDTLMLGHLGETSLSAASLANQIFFLFSLVISGIASGCIVLCSQFYGKGDMLSLRKVAAMNLKIALGLSLFFALALFAAPGRMMRIFTPEADVIRLGIPYLRVIAVSYLCFGLTNTLLVLLRSVQNVKLSLYIYLISLAANVFFNYLFIFGKFGAPALGITGAAIGTVIARGLELINVLLYLAFFEKKICFRPYMFHLHDRALLKDIVKYGLPVAAGELFWGLGLAVHSVILGHMGQAAVAANSICNVLHQFVLSFVQGLGGSSAVIMGGIIGSGDLKKARNASKALVKMFTVCGILTAAFMLLVSGPFLSFYQLEPQTLGMAKKFMFVYAVITMFRAIASPTISGIFWGSGDTHFAAIVDILFLWIMIPIGLYAAFVFHLAPPLVLLILRLETPIKAGICMLRLRTRRWIKVLVH